MPAFAGALDRVLEMFSDLRQFDQAKQWAEQFAAQRGDSAAVVDLISRQAEWSEQSSDYEAAAEMFVKARKWVAAWLGIQVPFLCQTVQQGRRSS